MTTKSTSRPAVSVVAAIILLFLTGSLFLRQQAQANLDREEPEPINPVDNLDLVISGAMQNKYPPVLKVHVENKSKTSPLTILAWNTPLDNNAVALGMFSFKEQTSQQYLPCRNIKLNRNTPPPDSAYIEIAAGATYDVDYEVSPPDVELERGGEYEIKATGVWGGVWKGTKEDVRGSHGFTGEFESNSIIVRVSEPPGTHKEDDKSK